VSLETIQPIDVEPVRIGGMNRFCNNLPLEQDESLTMRLLVYYARKVGFWPQFTIDDLLEFVVPMAENSRMERELKDIIIQSMSQFVIKKFLIRGEPKIGPCVYTFHPDLLSALGHLGEYDDL